MADRGITFSAPMVRALVEGRKTQTRRLLKLRGYRQFSAFGQSDTPGYDWHFRRADACWCDFRAQDLPLPHAPGDRLYVREHWRTWKDLDHLAPSKMRRDAPVFFEVDRDNCERHGRHRQAMHMPRWASRLTLLVTDVRVQRLQDISEADALAEGAYRGKASGRVATNYAAMAAGDYFASARGWYRELWDSLHTAPGTRWEDNPWIYAVSFEVALGNIDQIGGVA